MLETILGFLSDLLDTVLSALLGIVYGVVEFLAGFLPDDPFIGFIGDIAMALGDYDVELGALNWFIDIPTFATILLAAVTALAVVLIIRLILTAVDMLGNLGSTIH